MFAKKTIILTGFAVLLSALIIYSFARAGSLTPPAGSPAANGYTLDNVYNRLDTNATTSAGNHVFSPSGAPAGTLHTLTEIYNKINTTIDATRVATGTAYFGTTGTFLGHMWAGTGGSPDNMTGGSQLYGGIDDGGLTLPPDRYAGSWTQCTAGNSYCGTSDTGSAWEDNSTHLIWSKGMSSTTYALDDSSHTMSWYIANNCQETGSPYSCTKKTSSKTGCEANAGWYVPHQKQIMQAYVDGSAFLLEPARSPWYYYWSATTLSNGNYYYYAYVSYLASGITLYNDKSDAKTLHTRCVREAP